eukprot:TRINITY_DN9846_c0_g1_i1.p1 TRINITY_DN9846_c0_g1~~TRINITY_DN9846_c0_g1_i1.p1  ORF type:complete len:364 (-),score=24.74 TRINITY_DN9846_c0_g1_i1:10-1101(-)
MTSKSHSHPILRNPSALETPFPLSRGAEQHDSQSHVIIVGAGSSTGVPAARCLTRSPVSCAVCLDATMPGSRNWRNNPSALVQHNGKTLLIDCGKSFRPAMLRVLQQHRDRVQRIDGVLLTHAHADASFGLDDLREWIWRKDENDRNSETPMPVYVRDTDAASLESTFPYLFDRSRATGSGHVALIQFHTFSADEELNIVGIPIQPIVVEHGNNCECLAFRIGDFVYMSDVSAIPEEQYAKLDSEHGLELLIIDCTFVEREISSHVNLPQALELLRRIKPRKTLLTGLTHDFDYDFWTRAFQRNYATALGARAAGAEPVETTVAVSETLTVSLPCLDIELAYDTQLIPLSSIPTPAPQATAKL